MGGLETKSLCTRNGPNQYFLFIFILFFRLRSLGPGGGVQGGGGGPPAVVSRSNTSLHWAPPSLPWDIQPQEYALPTSVPQVAMFRKTVLR